jgi:hypothetical protein
MCNFITKAAEGTGKNIMGHIGPEIPNMGVVINCGTASIETNAALG